MLKMVISNAWDVLETTSLSRSLLLTYWARIEVLREVS